MSASHLGADDKIHRRLGNVKHIIIVLSGKGGVGKSSVAAQLSLSLSSTPAPPSQNNSVPEGTIPRVGILDIDLTGPSIPRMLGLDGQTVKQSSDGWVPVYADKEQRLAVMSVGFLLRSKNDSVVWRGPKKNAMIKQFLGDVRWGNLDYLIIDTPPGTSDEHISLLEYIRSFSPSAILVTTPQAVSLADNLRSLDFTRKTSLPLLGLVENMSGYVCPHCAECTNVWGRGGGEALAIREGISFLGRIPIDPGLVRVLDDAKEEAINKAKASNRDTTAIDYNRDNATIPPLDPKISTLATTPENFQGGSGVAADITTPLPAPNVQNPTQMISQGDANDTHKPEISPTSESNIPAGTILSRTLLQRYRDSQTFPIFQNITSQIVQAADSRGSNIDIPKPL